MTQSKRVTCEHLGVAPRPYAVRCPGCGRLVIVKAPAMRPKRG